MPRAIAYPCSDKSPVGALSFLVGRWIGEPVGKPVVEGFPGVLQSGDFIGRFELDEWVLTLKSLTSHKDMIVIYSGCGSARPDTALYIDGTRHTVQYCSWSAEYSPELRRATGVVFDSLEEPNLPGFRLRYTEVAPGTIRVELRMGVHTYRSTARKRGR